MDIDKCYEILEVNKSASPEQVRQAYKDLVNIWHPDRVSNNPRLKQKAEDKLKEINTAYEKVNSYLSSQERQEAKKDVSTSTYPSATEQQSVKDKDESEYDEFQSRSQTSKKPERIINQEQNIFSDLWSSISSALRQKFTDMQSRTDRDDVDEWPRSRGYGMGKGRGRCMGRGKGMGRGRGGGMRKGGMGRGRRR